MRIFKYRGCRAICGIILAVLFIYRVAAGRYKEKYGAEAFIIDHLGLLKGEGEKQKKEALKRTALTKKSSCLLYEHWCKKLHKVFLIMLSFLILGTVLEVKGQYENKEEVAHISLERPGYGEGSRDYSVYAKVDGLEKTELQLSIEEPSYTRQEWEAAVEEGKRYIREHIAGENISLDAVTGPLFLPDQIPGTLLEVFWETSPSGYIDVDGSIHTEELEEEITVTLTAYFSYEGEEAWEAAYELPIVLTPDSLTEEERFWIQWNREWEEERIKSEKETTVGLPQQVAGRKITYYTQEEEEAVPAIYFLVLGFIASALVWIREDQSIFGKDKQREKELLSDYPLLVNKFVQLLSAGMTISAAWGRIAGNYERKKKKEKTAKRYVYEEMLITWQEMKNGGAEAQAYENFGKRIQLLPYLKFSTLLSQNLRKGSQGLLELLNIEALEAFESRKELAKKQGEEAGTRLLLPMGIMLAVVMGILIIPAFMSF